jgi:transcriptional regulator with XRE-family HTH domain
VKDQIKRFREKARMSQAELAQLLGMSIQTVQGWEQGVRFPRVKILPRLAEALNCKPADLL